MCAGACCEKEERRKQQKSGIDTGIDVQALIALAKEMHGEIEGNYSGHQVKIGSGACCG